MAPAPIENLLNNDSHLELSCVSGSGFPQPYALVVVAEDLRAKLGDTSVRQSIESALGGLLTSVNGLLEHHEQLSFIAISSDDWSIANAMLTPTMKIRRSAIEDAYKDKVEGWYEAGSKVLWA